MDLSINIGSLKIANPVTVASGTFDYIEKYHSVSDIKKLGAIVPKTVTINPQAGNQPQRICETPSGMINSIGIENPGVDEFIKGKLKKFLKIGTPVFASISANNEDDFLKLTEKFNKTGISALELNLSCPNLKNKNLIAQDASAVYRTVKSVKGICKVPVIAKLTPNVTDITIVAKAAENAGADAVSMINTFNAMIIDIDSRKPVLGNVTGGLSGPAIFPAALNMVYKTAKIVNIPIIAMGGIMSAKEALQFLIAGASMTAVGTASFINPNVLFEVLDGIKDYMKKNKIENIKEIIKSIKD